MQAPGLGATLRDREGALARRLGNVRIRDLRRAGPGDTELDQRAVSLPR